MKKEIVQTLEHGLYRVFWKGGGTSLAAIGSLPDGRRWLAPCNWVNSPPRDVWAGESVWKTVKYVECLRSVRDEQEHVPDYATSMRITVAPVRYRVDGSAVSTIPVGGVISMDEAVRLGIVRGAVGEE